MSDLTEFEKDRNVMSPDIEERARQVLDRLLQMDPKSSAQETRQFLLQESRKVFASSEVERAAIIESLHDLPEHQRRAITLHVSGLSYVQIAEQEGEPSERILKELARAYAKIRLRLLI